MRPLEILTKCHEHNEAEGLPTNYNRLVNTVALLFPKFYDRHKRVISVKHAGIKSGRTVDPKLKLKFFINMLEFVHGKKFSCCTCGCRDYAMKEIFWCWVNKAEREYLFESYPLLNVPYADVKDQILLMLREQKLIKERVVAA